MTHYGIWLKAYNKWLSYHGVIYWAPTRAIARLQMETVNSMYDPEVREFPAT